MPRELHDHFFHQAKREGFLSRAAYKLIEIDDRKQLLQRGDRVLDCGAAPGSWIQVAQQRVGARGVVVGVDLKSIGHQFGVDHVQTIEGDLRELSAQTLTAPIGGALFHVVLSDMAPNTTGDRTIDHHESVRLCEALLARCGELLVPGGRLAMKVFEGETYPDLLGRLRRLFERVKGYRPKASRSESREMYIIAHGFRGPQAEPAPEPPAALPPRRPSAGWGDSSAS